MDTLIWEILGTAAGIQGGQAACLVSYSIYFARPPQMIKFCSTCDACLNAAREKSSASHTTQRPTTDLCSRGSAGGSKQQLIRRTKSAYLICRERRLGRRAPSGHLSQVSQVVHIGHQTSGKRSIGKDLSCFCVLC